MSEKTLTEEIVTALVGFPVYVIRNLAQFLLAILTDWNTTLYVAGAALTTYAADSWVVAALFVVFYVILRLVGDMAGTLARQINYHAAVLRDKDVAVVQLPEVLVRSPAQEVRIDDDVLDLLREDDPDGS